LLTSLAQVLLADNLVVEVAVLAPIAKDAMDRHAIARAARTAIAKHLGTGEAAVSAHDSSAV
jgi:hypothetical protein